MGLENFIAEALPDGRYNLVLEGVALFRVVEELEALA